MLLVKYTPNLLPGNEESGQLLNYHSFHKKIIKFPQLLLNKNILGIARFSKLVFENYNVEFSIGKLEC